jgi:glycosyltransferase involved in cell wall biosynthesis
MCLLEAMAVGIPCLASDILSNREILNDENIYKTGDTKDLRGKIKNFIECGDNNHYDRLPQKGIAYLQLIEDI